MKITQQELDNLESARLEINSLIESLGPFEKSKFVSATSKIWAVVYKNRSEKEAADE